MSLFTIVCNHFKPAMLLPKVAIPQAGQWLGQAPIAEAVGPRVGGDRHSVTLIRVVVVLGDAYYQQVFTVWGAGGGRALLVRVPPWLEHSGSRLATQYLPTTSLSLLTSCLRERDNENCIASRALCERRIYKHTNLAVGL
jgi:hypothetical protein